MSKHNYSQYSKKNVNVTTNKDKPDNSNNRKTVENIVAESTFEPIAEPTPVEDVVMPELVQETVSTVTLPETVKGIVVNCAKLNVRENATVDSGIVCVLDVMSEIQVDVNRTNDPWVYVRTTTGVEGYCMRQYVDICL